VGKQVWVIIPPPLPEIYSWLPGYDRIVERPPAGADPQLVFFFDAGNMERSGSSVRHIASHATIVNIDHHQTNAMFGDLNVIDPEAAAVGEMLVDMLDSYGYPITPSIATNLYTAIMTDTGGFRHENTTAQALEHAARLARLGANPGQIAGNIYKSRPLTTLKLDALSLAEMKVEAGGRLVWSRVTRAMLTEAGAVMAESEGIIDNLNSIEGLELAILFKEVGPRLTKISVRSRGRVDAAALTAEFGGGGHLRAAGAEVAEPMEAAVKQVLARAHAALEVKTRD
jgi:bifunctional oligoribonuclease and PAP phosphatase NrnA